MSVRILVSLFLLLATVGTAWAFDEARVEQLIEERLKASDAPGLAVAIRKGQSAPWVRTFGMAELEQASRMQAETPLPIASITKVFAGIAILLLEEDGVLALGDPLSRFLPDYPGAEEITLRQLLNHTSGVPNFTSVPAFDSNQAKDWTPEELVQLIRDLPPDFPPGHACRYSDSGFILLGLVVEEASGKSFGQFVKERITLPLDMDSTAMGENAPIVPLRARGYLGTRDDWQNAPYVSQSAPFSAGAMMSTVGDLVRLGVVLLPQSPLLEAASRTAMSSPAQLTDGTLCSLPVPGAKGSYGLGLELVTFDVLPGHRLLGKSGVFPGFGGFFAAFENSELTIAIIANHDDSLALVVPILRDLAVLLLDSPQ